MASVIRLVVGLGNPGPRYQDSRHNAGFWFADRVVRERAATWRREGRFFGEVAELAVDGRKLRVLKPMTFMNESGRAVGAIVRYFGFAPAEILIAHDEIDLAPGTVRLKQGGGHGGHNGLRDIMPRLGDPGFVRLRIGVGHPGTKEQVVGYVLSRAPRCERARIEDALDAASAQFELIVGGQLQRAMNALHRRAEV